MSNDLTPEDFAKDLLNPFVDKLIKGGIDDEYLIRQLKREFKSKEPKIIKVKGAVDQAGLPRGFKVITTSGLIMELEDAEGKKTLKAGNGETVLQYHVRNIGIAQKARMDAHKLRGDYPAEKHDLSIGGDIIVEVTKFGRSDCRKSNSDPA